MLLPSAYKQISSQKGHSLETVGHKGVAFTREDALAALAALSGSSIAVPGGDVYKMEGTRVRTTRDSWYVDRKKSEPLSNYLRTSRDAARVFVETYPDWKVASPKLAALDAKGVYIEKYSKPDSRDCSFLFTFTLSELGVTPVTP